MPTQICRSLSLSTIGCVSRSICYLKSSTASYSSATTIQTNKDNRTTKTDIICFRENGSIIWKTQASRDPLVNEFVDYRLYAHTNPHTSVSEFVDNNNNDNPNQQRQTKKTNDSKLLSHHYSSDRKIACPHKSADH